MNPTKGDDRKGGSENVGVHLKEHMLMCRMEIQKGKNPRANLTAGDEGKCRSENVCVR